MRFSTIIFSGVLAALSVSAQNTTSAVVSGTAPVSPAQSSQAACLAACPATDPNCRKSCIVDPTGAINPAIACINNCIQGNGTAIDNAAYESCQRTCRSSAALAGPTPAPSGSATTGAAAGATGASGSSGSANSPTSGAVKPSGTSGSPSGAATTSGAPATSSSSAANSDNVRVGMSVAGVVGVFAAVFAL